VLPGYRALSHAPELGTVRTYLSPGRGPHHGHGAPPRGVDVKPPPRIWPDLENGLPGPLPGSGTSKEPKTPNLTEIPFDLGFLKSKRFQSNLPKMRVFTRISGFWAYFGVFDPSGVPDAPATSRAGVVLHQPLAGPSPGGGGACSGPPGPPGSGIRDPGTSWDQGPETSGWETSHPGTAPSRRRGWTTRSRDSRDSRTRPPPRGWFYINPSRRGPVPGRGAPPGNPGSREVQSSPAGEWSSAHRAVKIQWMLG